jgi:hypothetical protein
VRRLAAHWLTTLPDPLDVVDVLAVPKVPTDLDGHLDVEVQAALEVHTDLTGTHRREQPRPPAPGAPGSLNQDLPRSSG